MPLDPQAQRVVDALAPFEEVAAVADHRVPVTGGEITVRLYRPAGVGPHPVLVFYHGGGWVIGDLYTHDGICRSIVNAAGCAVASVDYRLAPEFKYPTPVEDSYAGLLWVAANATRLGLDPARIGVGGDRAGGHRGVRSAAGRGRGLRGAAARRGGGGDPHPVLGDVPRISSDDAHPRSVPRPARRGRGRPAQGPLLELASPRA